MLSVQGSITYSWKPIATHLPRLVPGLDLGCGGTGNHPNAAVLFCLIKCFCSCKMKKPLFPCLPVCRPVVTKEHGCGGWLVTHHPVSGQESCPWLYGLLPCCVSTPEHFWRHSNKASSYIPAGEGITYGTAGKISPLLCTFLLFSQLIALRSTQAENTSSDGPPKKFSAHIWIGAGAGCSWSLIHTGLPSVEQDWSTQCCLSLAAHCSAALLSVCHLRSPLRARLMQLICAYLNAEA